MIKSSPTARWMEKHPEAVEFIDAWLEMRAKGDTAWGVGSVAIHLREAYNYPAPKSQPGQTLRNWIIRFKAEAWEAAIND